MLKSAVALALVALSLPSWAVQAINHQQFDVLYSGQGQATLASGSADPFGVVLMPGDGFDWTITAQGGAAWTVLSAVGAFPLMAFSTWEDGARTGDFTLELRLTGVTDPVLTVTETDAQTRWVHVGTNTIQLDAGLRFDSMHLSYQLHSALEDESTAADPLNLKTVPTTLGGMLPIFGTPEQYTQGAVIYGPVPEPATWALLLGGAALLGWRARRSG